MNSLSLIVWLYYYKFSTHIHRHITIDNYTLTINYSLPQTQQFGGGSLVKYPGLKEVGGAERQQELFDPVSTSP